MDPQISVFLDTNEDQEPYVGLVLVGSALFEDEDGLNPVAGLSAASARRLASVLIAAAMEIEGCEG